MIWIILFIFIILISLWLAFRSMKDYQEIPSPTLSYGLFLVRNKFAINDEFLKKIYQLSLNLNSQLSIEKLYKGNESVLVLYIPKNFINQFPELNLLELEDYLKSPQNPETDIKTKQLSVNEAYAWVINSKINPKKSLVVNPEFLKMLDLKEDQNFYFQIVIVPLKKEEGIFQATIRAIVADKNPNTKVELVKKINEQITSYTALKQVEREETTSKVFGDYILRTVSPFEVNPFVLTSGEILALIS